MKLDDAALDRRLDALPRRAAVPDALWPGIERRISRRRRWPVIGGSVAAGLAMVLLAGVLLTGGPPEATRPNPVAELIAAEVEVMGRTAPRPDPGLVEDLNAGWIQGWAVNQAAIEELESALEQHPEDRALLDHLVRARIRQARLINRAIEAPQPEVYRT